jgi:predicted amidohydrolase YtcJ
MVEPYADIPEKGITALNKEEFADLLKKLNEAGLDLHLHTVGDAASRVVLDGVELARRELGDSFRVKVTCAHLWVQDDADMDRFARLGVVANFTPAWHSGNIGGNPYELWDSLMGEKRASNMYRCRTLWDTGALVAWSSDDISYDDFKTWNPYLGMEVGMTRWTTEKTMAPDYNRTVSAFVPLNEVMSIEEMILGYTINGAKQLGIEAEKGSITAGKDADFLVFDNDLLTAEHEGCSYNKPRDVFFCGKKVK